MSNKTLAAIAISTVLIMNLCACNGKDNISNDNSTLSAIDMNDCIFDIDAVRSNINIHGHSFTIPQKIADLEEGFFYEFVGDEFGDGLYEVEISYNNEVILRTLVSDAHNKSEKAFIYNIALEDAHSNVLDITPFLSTKEDVLTKFGEPTEKNKVDILSSEIKEVYRYGIKGTSDGYKASGKFVTISFNADDIVTSIVINYLQ